MKTRFRILVLVTLVFSFLGTETVVRSEITVKPFTPTTIPGIPATGNYCLWRINKSFDGTLQSQLGRPYRCATGETRHSKTLITFRVLGSGGPRCDEPVPNVPANWFLSAEGSTVHRADGLAHFSGTVVLRNGAAGPVLFRGTMEVTGRVGTHQALGDKCDEREHFEGWLVARGAGALSNYTLRAVLAGKAPLPNGTAALPVQNRMTGVIVKAP